MAPPQAEAWPEIGATACRGGPAAREHRFHQSIDAGISQYMMRISHQIRQEQMQMTTVKQGQSGPEEPPKPSAGKTRPTKSLPTSRISFQKQLDILRACAAVNASTGKAVTNKEIADVVGMEGQTVTLGNAFFLESGLFVRGDGGFSPAAEVVSYYRAYEWNPETASHKLGPRLLETWFAKALLPRISYKPLDETEVVGILAEAAAATPDRKNQLLLIIDYLLAGGVVERDGSQIRLRRGSDQSAQRSEGATAAGSGQSASKDPPKPSIATAFAQGAEGRVAFNVSVVVDMTEFAGWQSDRITAFFGGIAQVLAAKGAIEKGAGSSQD